MDPRTRNLFALALVIVVLVTGGAALILSGGSGTDQGPAGTTAVDGVVIGVDAVTLTDVRSFTLRTKDGQTMVFDLSALENGVQFPPGHLAEHQVTARPVRVWYKAGTDTTLAIRLEDAP